MNSISPPTSPLVSTFTSHFVQALHDYLPSSAPITEEPVTCLFFKKGSIIEVFNRDNSGWWDGQCGEIRGWFPSNYVGRIGEAKRESVDFENEELTLWQQEKQQEKISARISFIVQVTNIMKELKKEYAREEMNTIQVLVFQLVSCIKAILVEFNIVDKDSPILKVYPELAKQRKTVFSTLNRLVLICKEQHKVQEELDVIADQLLYDLNQFERILQILPSFDDHSSSYSSRSSVNSLASNNYDKSSSSLLLSSFKLNTESILQSIFERQSALQDLISTLLVQLPLFLADRKQKTTNLLDITQRAIEAVKSFLSVVEHVCSNFEDLDKRLSLMIPDDPHLVSLVFAKESVYSAITNLVTAIRASTHPQLDQDPDGLELEHLIDCCQQVIKTTTECTKSCKNCLHPSEEEEPPPPYTEIPLRVPMDINRKISSLKAISQEIPERTLRPRASSVNGTKVPKRARGLSLSSLRSSLQKSTKSSAVSSESLPDWENKMPPASTPINEFLQDNQWTEEDVILNQEGVIKYASIEAIVQHLTFHQKLPDPLFVRAFFYNFRLFTTPQELLQLLIKRFYLQPPFDLSHEQYETWANEVLVPIRLRVYNVIKTWLESYFQYNQDLLIQKDLILFAETGLTEAMPGPAERMMNLIHKAFSAKENSRKPLVQNEKPQHHHSIFSNLSLFDDHTVYPPSILSKSTRNSLRKAVAQQHFSTIHMLDIDPIELARQITLLQNGLFCQIEPYEIMGQRFKKKSESAHIKATIHKNTQITSWISDSILAEVDVKKRANVLKYWIKVADACLHLNNYDTLMAIRSALDSTCIVRLKKTWDYVSSKYRTMWDPVYRATDSGRNFLEYRNRLKTAVAPCLPFLGVYLTDMTFMDDGNRDYCLSSTDKRLINMDKFIKITRVFIEIDQFQIPYRLVKIDEIQAYLKHTLESVALDDLIYYEKSLKLEPKDEE